MKVYTVIISTVILFSQGYCNGKFGCAPLQINNFTKVKYKLRGRMARFGCLEGRTIFGKKTISCLRGRWDADPPLCVAYGCRPFDNPLNGQVIRVVPNAIESFKCLPDYKLRGNSLVYCDGQSWNGTLPHCVGFDDNFEESWTCGFETLFLCGWTHGLDHEYPWRRITAASLAGNGPSRDHTIESENNGYFMFARFPKDGRGHKAQLFSPIITLEEHFRCMTFWYFLNSNITGILRIRSKSLSLGDPTMRTLKIHTENVSADNWAFGWVSLSNTKNPFQIVFEADSSRNMSYIAIDDVSFMKEKECNSLIPDIDIEDFTTNSDYFLPPTEAYQAESEASWDETEATYSQQSNEYTPDAESASTPKSTTSNINAIPNSSAASQTISTNVVSFYSPEFLTTLATAINQSSTISQSAPLSEIGRPNSNVTRNVITTMALESNSSTTATTSERLLRVTALASNMSTVTKSPTTTTMYVARMKPISESTTKKPLLIHFLKPVEGRNSPHNIYQDILTCSGRCGEPSTEFACGCEDHCMALASCCTDFMIICYSQEGDTPPLSRKDASTHVGVTASVIILISGLTLVVVFLLIRYVRRNNSTDRRSNDSSSYSAQEQLNRVSVTLQNSSDHVANLVFQGFKRPWNSSSYSDDTKPILDQE